MAFDLVSEISNAATTDRGGEDARDGRYLFAVRKLVSKDGQDGPMVIAELKVLESAAVSSDVAPNAVGSTVRFIQKVQKYPSAKGNVRKFIIALFGKTETSVSKEELKSTLNDIFSDEGQAEQGTRGMIVRAETFHQPNKQGADRVYLNFIPVRDQGDIKSRAATLDG